MSDLATITQVAQILGSVAQVGSTAYSLANRPSQQGTPSLSAMMPTLGMTGAINDPASVRRAQLGGAQTRGLSGAAPAFLSNLQAQTDQNLAALGDLRGSLG